MPDDRGPAATAVSLAVDQAALKPLIVAIVNETLMQLRKAESMLPDKLCFSEQEAARLLGVNAWVLRDERLRGKIAASAIVGRRIRYSRADLLAYLADRRCG
jgi:hypothetical protein